MATVLASRWFWVNAAGAITSFAAQPAGPEKAAKQASRWQRVYGDPFAYPLADGVIPPDDLASGYPAAATPPPGKAAKPGKAEKPAVPAVADPPADIEPDDAPAGEAEPAP